MIGFRDFVKALLARIKRLIASVDSCYFKAAFTLIEIMIGR